MGTQADLRNMILSRLGAADGVAAPNAEDAVRVEDEMRSVLAGLADDGLLPFDIEGDIPAAYMTPLSYIVAQELIADYGQSQQTEVVIAGAERGRRRLYTLQAQPEVGTTVRGTYY